MRNIRIKFCLWLERLAAAAVIFVAVASIYRTFGVPFPANISFAQLQSVIGRLSQESDPIRREDLQRSSDFDGKLRRLDAQMPAQARVFYLGMLGPENFGQIGYYQYLAYYLFPREVAISLHEPPAMERDRISGRDPVSLEELRQAGYDFAVWYAPELRNLRLQTLGPLALGLPEAGPASIPKSDALVALLLPLLVAINGSRIVRWLFKDLQGILSTGELLATGLVVGAFFLTQLTLGLRLAGASWERPLAVAMLIWAVGEVLLWLRGWRTRHPQLKARSLWWLLLVPAGLILWCQFRLAGLLGLQEFDSVAIWAFKARMLHCCSGRELWACFHNPAWAYAHLDYPLLVPLLHALTYGALGHVNEFVTKFWNQWMLLLLAWAVLGTGRFPGRRPWLAAALASAIVLLPLTRGHANMEGGTTPMLFFVVLSSLQLAIGMRERQAGRLRLGLLLLLATAMVKFEGMVLLALWCVLLALDRDSRAVFWPPRRPGWAGLLGLSACVPYLVFRLNHPVPHPESGWAGLLLNNTGAILHMFPMTLLAMVSRRFFSVNVMAWSSPDNQHALWQGRWMGWPSLLDPWTQGASWACVLLLCVAWCRGGRLRSIISFLCVTFLAFAVVVSFVWCATRPDYNMALAGSDVLTGGRYLYPVLMAWFVAGVILLLRESPGETLDSRPSPLLPPKNPSPSLPIRG